MHRAALKTTGTDGSYELEECTAAEFHRLVGELRNHQWSGFNVTMPFKGLAGSICDRLTDHASAAGSVNTLGTENGDVIGESTDAVAFAKLFSDDRLTGRPVMIIGSGGSAAAALSVAGPRVFLSARNTAVAEGLSQRFADQDIIPVPFGDAVPGAVVVNATPIGMKGEALPESVLTGASGLIDLPYGRNPTPAVSAAREKGIEVCDGVRFLSLQAAASFQWWTGVPVDPLVMERAARND